MEACVNFLHNAETLSALWSLQCSVQQPREMVQDAGYSAIQYVVKERPKLVWCAHGIAMSDEEFIDVAQAIARLQSTKQNRFYVIAAPRDSKLWKKETARESSV
eukprot:7485760-Karenia_brevis.AAC.1